VPDTLDKLISKGLVTRGSDPELVVTYETTGIEPLDEVMGHGIPFNRFTHIHGEWSAGKTLLAMFIAAEFQRRGHTVALVDAEQAFDPFWWGQVGVNIDDLIVSQPGGGEAAVDVACSLIGNVDLIILDSIAGLVPLAVQDKDANESVMGRRAQLVARLYEKALPLMRRSHTAFITINQVRVDFGPGNQDVLPGGVSQGFWSSVMLRLRRSEWIKNSAEQRVGFKMRVTCVKNKTGEAWKSVDIPINFDGSFDYLGILIQDALARGIIAQGGAWYRLPADLAFTDETVSKDPKTGEWRVMGREKLTMLIDAHPEARAELELRVYPPKDGRGFADGK